MAIPAVTMTVESTLSQRYEMRIRWTPIAACSVGRRGSGARCSSVTMMDVAKLADVSPSTVSLYLRKPDAVSPAAGQDIARAISTLGYVPNLVAGGLAAASSKVVSIIVPSIRNAFFAETVSTLQSELAAEGLAGSPRPQRIWRGSGRGPGSHGPVLGPRCRRADRPVAQRRDPQAPEGERRARRRDVGTRRRADRHGGRLLAPAGRRVGRPASPVEGSPRPRLPRRAHAGGSPRRAARRAALPKTARTRRDPVMRDHQSSGRRDGRGRRRCC